MQPNDPREITIMTKKDEIIRDEVSPYDEEIDQFFDRVNNYTEKASLWAKRLAGKAHDQDFTLWQNWPLSSFGILDQDEKDGTNGNPLDEFFSRPYQSRTGVENPLLIVEEILGSEVLGNNPFDRFWSWGPFEHRTPFTKPRSSPFGLSSYTTPSAAQYHECSKKEGLSLWDLNGLWRCLFPAKNVPADILASKPSDVIATKEDFESRSSGSVSGPIDLGPLGTFFRHYEDLLQWRGEQYGKRVSRAKQRIAAPTESSVTKASDSGKLAVGSLVSSSTSTENDEVVRRESRTEYYDDNTLKTTTVVKRRPSNAQEWNIVEESSEEGQNKLGWFWNS